MYPHDPHRNPMSFFPNNDAPEGYVWYCPYCKKERNKYFDMGLCFYRELKKVVRKPSPKEECQKLIDKDIEWLMQQPRTLERAHIRDVLNASVDLLYPPVSKG